MIDMEPFRISMPQDLLDDLRRRLAHTRWPEKALSPVWRYGADTAFMRDIVAYWCDGYDWRRAEAAINRFPNYLATVDGLPVHVIVEPGSGSSPRPLLLTHGWPGSIVEFLPVIEKLAHPERFGGQAEDAFTVVVPSLPGYGFSPAPAVLLDPRQIGRLWHGLMTRNLGFSRFFAQGGDWGSVVTSWLAFDHPESLIAIHLNLVGLSVSGTTKPEGEDEARWKQRYDVHRATEAGYRIIQGTKPDTLAFGLTDSPVGLAAWILEKFHGWTVPGSSEAPPFDRDHLLDNVMLYWIPGPAAASWLYISLIERDARTLPPNTRIEVPTGMLLCGQDVSVPAPDSWIRRSYNLVHRRDAATLGHFLALQAPDVFVEELRRFFRENYS